MRKARFARLGIEGGHEIDDFETLAVVEVEKGWILR